MPTIKEINIKMDALYNGWLKNFRPLYRAGNNLKRVMIKRIFGKGSSGGYNSEMKKLPTRPYSTKAIYVSANSLRSAPASFKFGKPTTDSKGKTKKGKPIKSLYFPQGYAQLKTKTSAKLPLQLTGNLFGAFVKSGQSNDGLSWELDIDESQDGKIDGLERKYGFIFQPTDEEEKQFLLLHGQYVVEQINDMLK
jgi:hypothetical protein